MRVERHQVWGKHWREIARTLGMRVRREQANAMDYLESVGQRFCVDFGLKNAVQNAKAHRREARRGERAH